MDVAALVMASAVVSSPLERRLVCLFVITCMTRYIFLFQGMVIGLPPVLNFGKGELQKRVLDDVFSGKKASWRLKQFVDTF